MRLLETSGLTASAGAMGFAVPPGFVASLQTQPRELMSIQLDSITVAHRLSLREPLGPSVSCSREIFAEVQVGARTVPRSLKPGRFGYSALSRHFTVSLDHQRDSVQRPPTSAVLRAYTTQEITRPINRGMHRQTT
jgi:hypothetical protein